MKNYSRRSFIKTSATGGLSLGFIGAGDVLFPRTHDLNSGTKVSLTTGTDRADMVFRALLPFSNQIKREAGDRRIILKVNNVLIYVPLACTHLETLQGILEFLRSINKHHNVIIAESSASDSTLNGFENYGYNRLLSQYPVRLVDLDNEKFEMMHVTDERDFKPHMIKVSSLMTDPESYVVSVARMKTHNTVGATLSLKNIVLGSPIKDKGFTLYNEDKRFSGLAKESKQGSVSYKRLLHGGGFRAINYNLATLAQKLHPDLAIIDGFEGMEGNGPTLGTPIDHRVCVVSQDWLAADRVGVELMGIDFAKIGYLNYCKQMGLGNADLQSIDIIGETITDHIRSYRLPDNFEKQLVWMNPRSV